MIYMLSSFDLKPGEGFAAFSKDYEKFVADLLKVDIIDGADPLGTRVLNTPMDTDTGHTQVHYSVMYFRSRAQLDAAYAHIEAGGRAGTAAHLRMYRRLTNTSFLCWEDRLPEKELR